MWMIVVIFTVVKIETVCVCGVHSGLSSVHRVCCTCMCSARTRYRVLCCSYSALWLIKTDDTQNQQNALVLFYFLDVLCYSICRPIQHVSIPPGIIIRDSCKSKNCTNITDDVRTCYRDINRAEDDQLNCWRLRSVSLVCSLLEIGC
jgi:hypothetical protein